MKKTFFIAGAFFVLALASQSCKKSSPAATTTVNVSGLFSITGNWSSLGIDSREALQLATADINTYLQNKNASFRMSVSFYDTKLNPDSAQQAFMAASNAGTHFIIGPQSSAELAVLVPLADAAKMIVVSQGSTAGSLAIAGDPVFRFCPNDKVEGPAIANTIYKAGVRGLVTLPRNDAGNLGLQSSTGAAFVAKGGTVNAMSAYSSTTTDFSSVIADLKTQVSQLVGTYGAANTAVYLASFDEGADIFALAAGDSVLSSVKWYGGDGIALSNILLSNTSAGDFAIKTGFFAPSYGLPVSLQSIWQPVSDRINAATGIAPDAFALAAYDAMWVIAYTLEATNGSTADFNKLKTSFPLISNSYDGITGVTKLDSFGDRASGTFDYWGIAKDSAAHYGWKVVGESE